MGLFDRVVNLGKGWVKVKRRRAHEGDPGVPLVDLSSPPRRAPREPASSVDDLIERARSTAREAGATGAPRVDGRSAPTDEATREHLRRIEKAFEEGLITRKQYEGKKAELQGDGASEEPGEIKRTL